MTDRPEGKLLAGPDDLDPFARDLPRLGGTLMALEARMQELKGRFDLDDDDLNLDLGPLGRLV